MSECATHHYACDCRERMFADRIAELEAEIALYRQGYKGGCYTCEQVGELNVKLEADSQRLRKAATGAVEYMRLTSPHPSQAMDELQAALEEE